jgi:two-component system, chemotaxis family, CheB/CheR fusion protein
VRSDIIPRIIAQKGPADPIRVWSAGCATGEEAYTLAILFAEALGADAFRSRVKIYATDVDESALSAARLARYAPRNVEGVPPDILERYFEASDGHYVFRKDVRRSVIFGRNDLIQDAPISRIDLLVCRNTLMYFDAEAQARILGHFFFALNDGGFLCLGRAETLLTHATAFVPVNLRRRVFQKGSRAPERRAASAPGRWAATEADALTPELRDAAIRTGTVAQLVVDPSGALVLSNERATLLFRLGPADVGRPLSDLDVSYRPIDLASMIDQAYTERRAVVRAAVEWRPPGSGETRWFDVQVIPLHSDDAAFLGTVVAFGDVTAQRQLQSELEQSEHELQAAYEELQSTNEELETTNEELQSTVEELETTNEELQSTNEELETMNEELQSTNEELQTMNEELQTRGDQVDHVNRFLEQILTSLSQGVAVLDRDLRILVWNRKADDLWGLRAEEVEGRYFLGLDIGLPVERLHLPIRNALTKATDPEEVVLPATNRRGKAIQCRVVCAPLASDKTDEPAGVIVLMEQATAEAATADYAEVSNARRSAS